jgi:hypothetical protein
MTGRGDIPWDDIDPEIRELVRVLNDLGFPTHQLLQRPPRKVGPRPPFQAR